MTTLSQEEQSLADLVVFVKKPKGGRSLKAYDILKEAQNSHPGFSCRLHTNLNVKVVERELALQQIIKKDRVDLEGFRKVLRLGDAIGLDIVDGTKGSYALSKDSDDIDMLILNSSRIYSSSFRRQMSLSSALFTWPFMLRVV